MWEVREACCALDLGEGLRRWRALDLGSVPVWLEADAPRVDCFEHGVTVGQVPWARHNAGHTRFFDDQVAWLATVSSKSAVCELMRVAWRTVGAIVTRVWDDTAARVGTPGPGQEDVASLLRRIGGVRGG